MSLYIVRQSEDIQVYFKINKILFFLNIDIFNRFCCIIVISRGGEGVVGKPLISELSIGVLYFMLNRRSGDGNTE
jgi:hypothetical protein